VLVCMTIIELLSREVHTGPVLVCMTIIELLSR